MFPGSEDHVGAPAKDNRLFVEAVLYRYRARHSVARPAGAFWRLEEHPSSLQPRDEARGMGAFMSGAEGADADHDYAMLDSTSAPAHQHSAGAQKKGAGQALGCRTGGLTTKIHATCDALGHSTVFFLTPGQAHARQGAEARVLAPVAAAGKTAVIPPPSRRKSQRNDDTAQPQIGPQPATALLIQTAQFILSQFQGSKTRIELRSRNKLGTTT